MEKEIRAFDDNDWINDLSEIQSKLSQTEICEVIYLYGYSLKGKLFSEVLYQNEKQRPLII